MKTKLIYAKYDRETGISTATVRNRYGTFTGTSKLREEDRFVESSFLGCQFAETKAIIKSLKEQRKRITIQLEALENLHFDMQNMKEYQPDSFEARRLRRRIYELREEKMRLSDRIVQGQSFLNKLFNAREILRKKMLEKGGNE